MKPVTVKLLIDRFVVSGADNCLCRKVNLFKREHNCLKEKC